MKLGRNEPCPCGSGKKYKQCCINSISEQKENFITDLEQVLAVNPHLDLDELNVVVQHRVDQRNNQPIMAFCGLNPTQMTNWLYAPFNELNEVVIKTPDDLSNSPLMRYLTLILDEAMLNGGSFKATSKGNLPTKIVKQASALLPEFKVAKYPIHTIINAFTGVNEDKFNALHYTRILAEISGIIYRRSGRYHLKKLAQKQYKTQGIKAFFIPMLEAATSQYNWGYFDGWEHSLDLRTFWLFMLWRLQAHGSFETLLKEMTTAFPDILLQLDPQAYSSPTKQLGLLIEFRFIKRFLEFWGFVTIESKAALSSDASSIKIDIQPLLTQTFQFNLSP